MGSQWKIALKLNHANVLALREVHIDDVYIYMVMDMCDGGELFDRVARGGGLGEDLARYYFKQIVAGLGYCHEQQVWHRDLKLENLLMVEKSTDSLVKIADFGLSKDAAEMKTVDASCGTVSYMAPEICLLQPGQVYNEAKADIWSLGVILYVMRCCAYPFGHDGRGGERTDVVFARAMRRRWKNPGQLESKCSSSLQDLIKSMLSVEPDKRPTLAEIQQHPWFQTGKPYIPPPANRTQGRHGPMASPQMSPHWQWPSSGPAPEPSPGSWDSAKDTNSGRPLIDEEFSLGAGQFVNTPPRRSHSLISRLADEDGPREFCLMVESRDDEFADVFANGRISCELTATTAEELQSGLADMLGLPDVLHIWYTDPTFRVPAVILDLAVLPQDALVVVKRRDDTNDQTQQSVKSPKQDPIIKRLRKVRACRPGCIRIRACCDPNALCVRIDRSQELVDLTRNAPPGISAMPVSDDMLRWKAVIKGQPDTCWEGGVFHFAIEFPQGYPFKPLKLWLETRMYHPNVSCSVQPPDRITADGGYDFGGGTGKTLIDAPQMNFASGMLRRWSPAHTLRKGECAIAS